MIPFALDTETALIAPGRQAPPLACMSYYVGGVGGLLGRREGWQGPLNAALENQQVTLVGHGIAYDMAVFANEEPRFLGPIVKAYEQDRIVCTEVRQKLLDIAAGVYRDFTEEDQDTGKVAKITYDLEALSWRLLRRKLDKNTWRLRYGELLDTPTKDWPEGARIYPVEDARAPADIYQVQAAPTCEAYLVDQHRQARAAFWIKLMSNWGIRTDPQGVWELADKTGREYEKIAGDLRGVGLLRADKTVKRKATGLIEKVPGSRNVEAARTRLIAAYRSMGKPVPFTDPSAAHRDGQPSLAEQSCVDSGDPDLIKYARLTSLKSVLSKDIPMLEKGTVTPIHSKFEVLESTGRTGSTNPNVQNFRTLPGVRECVVPACTRCGTLHTPQVAELGACPGCGGPICVLVSADFGGLELFTLSEVCYFVLGYSTLGDALNAGRDPHLMIAEQILEVPYGDLKKVKGSGSGPDCISDKGLDCQCLYCTMYNARQVGKVLNFGCGGGLGAESLVAYAMSGYGVRLTVEQATDLIRTWKRTWTEMKAYFQWINSQTSASFPLVRQIYSNRYRAVKKYTEACNTFFQGLGADIGKAAGWELMKACYLDTKSPLFGFRIINFIHDEFVTVGPETFAHEAAHEQSRLMVKASKPWLPHLKDIEAPPTISRVWSKNAKQVWENKRLIAWAP